MHQYRPISDNQLRLYWQPVYVEDGVEVIGGGSTPSTVTVPVQRLLFPVRLHDGVLSHAAARRLDFLGYRYEKLMGTDLNGEPVEEDIGLQLNVPFEATSAPLEMKSADEPSGAHSHEALQALRLALLRDPQSDEERLARGHSR